MRRTFGVTATALLLLTALLIPAGGVAAREETCLEDPCEVVLDYMDCVQGPEKVLRVDAKYVAVEFHMCPAPGGGGQSSSAEGPVACKPVETADPVHVVVREDCSAQVDVFRGIICIGPWGDTTEVGNDRVRVTVSYCTPPGGIPVEPGAWITLTDSHDGAPSCERIDIQDAEYGEKVHLLVREDCSVQVDLLRGIICVGGWGDTAEVGNDQARVTVSYCTPPGGVPVDPTIVGPASASGQGEAGSCEGWSHGLADHLPDEVAVSDEGCLAHVNSDDLWACLGPWGTYKEGSVGPVGYSAYICHPPIDDPAMTTTSSGHSTCDEPGEPGEVMYQNGNTCKRYQLGPDQSCLGGSVERSEVRAGEIAIVWWGCGNPDQGGPGDPIA